MFNIRGTNANYQNTFSIKIKGESWTDCIRNLKEVLETIVLDDTSEIEIKFEEEERDATQDAEV